MKVGDLVKWVGGLHYLHKTNRVFLITEITQDMFGKQWFRLMDREGIVEGKDIEVINESR